MPTLRVGRRLRRQVSVVAAVAAVSLAAVAVPDAGAARARIPAGFIGVNIDRQMTSGAVRMPREFSTMVGAGVESVRVLFAWGQAQPYPSFAGLSRSASRRFRNVRGVPTDFSQTDQIVRLAASHGMSVLPVIEYAPPWASTQPGSGAAPPSNDAAYAAYVSALVGRYGPRGSFWREHRRVRRVPIKEWQIWNEPDLSGYWSDTANWTSEYIALLRATRPALKAADPTAKLVLAGLTNDSWSALQQIYAAGAGNLFDIAAVHPFTHSVFGVADIAGLFRNVMAANGDARKPLIVGEFSWPSSLGITPSYNLAVTPRQQASRVQGALRLLAGQRTRLGIAAVYWYTWLSSDRGTSDMFEYAGLRQFDARSHGSLPKPAFAAFKRTALALEGCRRKGSLVGECRR